MKGEKEGLLIERISFTKIEKKEQRREEENRRDELGGKRRLALVLWAVEDEGLGGEGGFRCWLGVGCC